MASYWKFSVRQWFARLSPESVHWLETHASFREFQPGSPIQLPDQGRKVIFFLTDGKIRVHDPSTRLRPLFAARISPGELFGLPADSPVQLVAVGKPWTRVVMISTQDLLKCPDPLPMTAQWAQFLQLDDGGSINRSPSLHAL